MANKLMGFLFGKNPDIFDKDGSVRHILPKEKWDAWQSRYIRGEEYNWQSHTGTRAKENAKPQIKN